ncbi:DUF6252 family protein [Aquimarina sediminis]|uniref:DUF6252 family protein n=1 Tax=Aquimarina sediminis TaxID=2070536 RepID=UPI000FFEF45C|nr:DUF6252 family protein [Aquimarina sediminis]
MNTRKILNFVLLVSVINLISCSKDEDEVSTPQKVLKATVNGKVIEFGNSTTGTTHASATLWDDKRLVIIGQGDDDFLRLTVGEVFLDHHIQEGNYKIGTVQDNLETNIYFLDYNDTNTGNGPSYIDVYGCNVLSNDQVGKINITKLDTENKVVSGTFSGTLFRWIDIATGELKIVELEGGEFSLPYTEKSEDLNPDRNLISAKVNGYRFMSEDPGSPESGRSTSSGIDKITINGYDGNFGRMKISMLSTVETGNSYRYKPDGSFQSLGVSFQNRINLPEDLLSNNPNQSNDSYISIITHDQKANIIEGKFYIENSEIEGRRIIDGYFKANYIDSVE